MCSWLRLEPTMGVMPPGSKIDRSGRGPAGAISRACTAIVCEGRRFAARSARQATQSEGESGERGGADVSRGAGCYWACSFAVGFPSGVDVVLLVVMAPRGPTAVYVGRRPGRSPRRRVRRQRPAPRRGWARPAPPALAAPRRWRSAPCPGTLRKPVVASLGEDAARVRRRPGAADGGLTANFDQTGSLLLVLAWLFALAVPAAWLFRRGPQPLAKQVPGLTSPATCDGSGPRRAWANAVGPS